MRRTHYDRSSTEPRPYDDAIPHLCLSTDGPSSKCRKRRPRALRPVRAQAGGGTRRRTAPSSAVRRSVPVRTFADWHDPPPGFVEADLVAHSGPSASGSFVQTLVLTDIATGWTECGPLLVREQGLLSEVLTEVRKLLPFDLLGFDTDNDSVFMNETVRDYCQAEGIAFTRCRPYRKNDQAFVEQKNGRSQIMALGNIRVRQRSLGWGAFQDEAIRHLSQIVALDPSSSR